MFRFDPALFFIAKAPTLEPVLTLSHARADWPVITTKCQIDASDTDLNTPLNDVQKSLLAIAKRAEVAKPAAIFPRAALADLQRKAATEAKTQQTYRDALKYLHPNINLPE